MQAGPNCLWCIDVNFTTGENFRRSRCNLVTEFNGTCENTTDISSSQQIQQDDGFNATIQVRPQQVEVQLRPGQPSTFNISVKPAPDFPVDIYFLMDVSFSMRDDLLSIATLGEAIADAIQVITKNYRLGFGSFVDKAAVPFIEGPKFPNFPCSFLPAGITNCETPFAFKHSFDFSQDTTKFINNVKAQNISGDLDSPEGGFDGLMQAAVCQKEIGWRTKGTGRRIVLYVTDALPKIAGDGKLIGGLRQNDGKCYLTKNVYTAAGEMDYPSIAQLKDVMKANEIVPIIAVTSDVLEVYKQIASSWSVLGAAVDQITGNSSNIVDLVRDNYQKISSTVKLVAPSDENLKFEFEVIPSSCPTYDAKKPSECSNVKIGQKVDIQVKVTARSCPEPNSNPATSVDVGIPGFGDVKVAIKYLCDCTCSSNTQNNSPLCTNRGTLECGICKCNKGFFGSVCQCDASTQGSVNDTLTCIDSTGDNSTLCSGKGSCVCGKCECFKETGNRLVSGPFCQCKNFGCNQFEGKECGGASRGSCVCNKCECKEEFTGSGCGSRNCPVTKEKYCTIDEVECNNNGQCDCPTAKCKCNIGFTGSHCQTCVRKDCKCEQHQNCVLCGVFDGRLEINDKTKKVKTELSKERKEELNCSLCKDLKVVMQNATKRTCSTIFNISCKAIYHYETDQKSGNDTLFIQRYLECAAPLTDDNPDSLAIVLGTIAGIVLLGILLLLIFKLLVTLHDKREYKRFEKSNKKSQWQEDANPIYHPPEQQFENPAFAGEQ